MLRLQKASCLLFICVPVYTDNWIFLEMRNSLFLKPRRRPSLNQSNLRKRKLLGKEKPQEKVAERRIGTTSAFQPL